MKIVADTNILARALLDDDPRQSRIARTVLAEAELIAVTLPSLCELVWVLARGHKLDTADIIAAIRHFTNIDTVTVDRAAVEAGLAMLEAGGDFADGVIAHQGAWMGGEAFLSFDKRAVKLLRAQGLAAHLPA